MNVAALISAIANLAALIDAANRLGPQLEDLRDRYRAAKAAGQVTAEQDAQVTTAFETLRAHGFAFS